jgi:uncharacterized protein (TIGR02001 family)
MTREPETVADAERLLSSADRRAEPTAPRALFGAVLLLSLPCLLCAADGAWSASIAGTTDYVYRGVSQAYDSGALQLGVNYQNPQGWFLGSWSSNVAPYPFGTSAIELDLYTGMHRALSDDFNAALTYTHYQYLDDSRPARYNYDELSASVSYLDKLVATFSYQPDSTSYSELGFAAHRPSLAYELAGRWPLPRGFALTAGAGYYDLHRLFGVRYWAANAGAQFTYRRITIDLSHFFVDPTVERLYEDADANGDWVLTALFHF